MAASTYKCLPRIDAMPPLRKNFKVNTSSEPISKGDLVQVSTSTGRIQILQDDEVTAGHKFVGIADGEWRSTLNDYTELAEKGLPVIVQGVFEARVASASYAFGAPLEYNASTDDGSLKAFTGGSSNQYVAWIYDDVTGTRTSALVLVNILDSRSNVFGTLA